MAVEVSVHAKAVELTKRVIEMTTLNTLIRDLLRAGR